MDHSLRDLIGTSTPELLRELANYGVRLRCAMPEHIAQAATLRKWPGLDVWCFQEIVLPGLTPTEITQCWETALASWAAVCALRPRVWEPGNPRNAHARAAAMDGPSGTLAESYLPYPGISMSDTLTQRYDNTEGWQRAWFTEVATHELGHLFGLDHGPEESIMCPWSNGGRFTTPQRWDIEQMVKRYGAFVGQPPPPVTPPAGEEGFIITAIRVPGGEIWKADMKRVYTP